MKKGQKDERDLNRIPAMAELKTRPNDDNVNEFLETVSDPKRRSDAIALQTLMESVTSEPSQMWGDSIVGFRARRLRYESGHELDWFTVGFSPRKQNLTIYVTGALASFGELLARLGPHSTGKGCLYVKRLEDVDIDVLRELVAASIKQAGND